MPLRTALVLLAVAASGCTPRLVHRLDVPDPGVGVWHQGQHLRTARADGVEAEVGYVRSEGEDHVLWARVTNLSADTVVVDPALFRSTAFQSVGQAEARDSTGRAQSARDPEAALLDVDLTAARRDATARTQLGLAVVSTALVATAALADPPDTPEQEAVAADAAVSAEIDVADAVDARGAAEAARVDGRAYWEGVLRRTTLAPNTFIDGLVHLPIDPAAYAVVVEVVVGETRVPFLFRQRNLRP